MNKPWIQDLRRRRPARDRRRRLSLRRRALRRRRSRSFGDLPAFECFGQTMTYAEIDRASRAVAAWLQAEARREARRPHRADVPERLRLPDRHARHPPRRRGAGERQPALHPARARAPAQRRRRRDHHHLRRLDPDARRDHRPDAGQDGDHRRPRRRQRAADPLAGGRPAARRRHPLRRRARGGREPAFEPVDALAATTSCSSSTPAAPPASRRARC